MSPQLSSIKQKQKLNKKRTPPPVKRPFFSKGIWTRFIIYPLLFVFVYMVRILLCEIFYLPQASMEPSLFPEDKVLATKKTYGYSRHSFTPFPSVSKWFGYSEYRLLYNEPNRGDIIVFLSTFDDTYLIKRVIGLPGDTIIDYGNKININGEDIQRKQLGTYSLKAPITASGLEFDTATAFIETLSDGIQYKIIEIFNNVLLEETKIYHVPENHFFVMGDNRDNSEDSRTKVGFVPIENLVGKISFKFYSKENGFEFNVIN